MDTWMIWNMTGGVDGGLHVTDPTNASRTMLMDLDTLTWDADIAEDMGIPLSMLPEIRSSLGGVRQGPASAARSPACRSPASSATSRRPPSARPACRSGEAKNTYGTGNFMLLNTGTEKVPSQERPAHHGLLQDR